MVRMRILLTGILMMTGLACIGWTQRGGGGPRGTQDPGEGDGGYAALSGRPYQENRLDRFTELLRLNKQQKNDAKGIFDAAQKEAEPIREELQKTRTALAAAYLSKQGQPAVDQLTASYAHAVAEMTGVELRAFSKLCDSLAPDQQKRVGPVFPLMTGMFAGRDWNRGGNN